MNSADSREQEAGLGVGELPKNHARDIHILSFAFLFIFLAYGAAQNLESTVNMEHDLGTTSLGIIYISFTLFSLMASPMVRMVGSKRALVLGTSGYWLFIASNLKPSWYTMVPASLYLGFAASIIWVGQGTYLTSTARSHAKDCHLHEGTVIGNFTGEFWGMFASTQVIGNLISLVLLKYGKEGRSTTGTTLLFSVFLGSMTLGTVLMCFLSGRDIKGEDRNMPYASFSSSVLSLLKSVISPLCSKRMLLIIPLLAYSGAEFTKNIVTPALGVSGVGGAMAAYGASDAICSWAAGRFTSGLSSITFIVSGGAFLQMVVLLWLLLKYSLTSGILGPVYPFLMAIIWGIGDGEAAFAQLKVWQSASTAAVFFLSPYISFHAMLFVMIVALCISIAVFLVLTLQVENA
ncbi:UNC93-like protein 3 [Cinnamomum micranthum f. kanehirae]|uniref:UNC93-like protein 3 n=1 Tax=Cinnamomum micranthum f. kanehirae TaxID=337451 RepID=A0A3S3Q1B4_9MAGN|nr:UNC93-like protein 3 [Cinnamomum micranthum f. kanehirae]